METVKATIKNAWPYQQDKMNLPVPDLETAIPFYETIMGFRVVSRQTSPFKSATIDKDGFQIGLAENGGDPTQDGCFFEVDDVEKAFAELRANGLEKSEPIFDHQTYGTTDWKVFFVVAPDGLCYCYGERQN
ncbi:VOC family protein [Spirosoma sp. HMF3257]|uniref:VOC family protein n=1 Tax=Spirosoma telluris TaxID=2183553 RepID=A0A327NI70_9BACT|nr:VOC family protein [Spirosoma telluris]RAI75070.1 VOC family protein [Spirosoma telluris]